MSGGFDRRGRGPAGGGVSSPHAAREPAPGKVTLVDLLPMPAHDLAVAPVQRSAAGPDAGQSPAVPEIAAKGVAGSGGALPHAAMIRQLFGRHDVSGVKAHVGGEAATASRAIGAEAYATGDHVAFAAAPSLHTAAHEAAHVVQQRGGVHLKGGVGESGDAYEQHANAVADAVVQGKSAEALLDPYAGAGTGSATSTGVQRFDSFEHQEIGDEATKGAHGELKTVELAPGYRVSYGEMVALGGDFFGSMANLRAIAAVPGKGAGSREEIEYIRRVKLPNISQAEQDKRTKEFSEAAVLAADKRYYKLASSNASHFANPETGDAAKSTLDKANASHLEPGVGQLAGKMLPVPNNAAGFYRQNHLAAIGEAVAAGKAKKSIDTAMAANAFSDHYLTDSFSSGHNKTARTSISQYWNGKQPMFFSNFKGYLAEKLAYYINDHNTAIGVASVDMINDFSTSALEETLAKKGIPDFQFGDLVAGTVHDYDNENGIAVKIEGVDKHIFGDDALRKGDTMALVTGAVKASTGDIEAAYETGAAGQSYDALYAKIAPRGMFRGEEMMPVVKPDAELAAADRSVKWDYPDVGSLLSDAKFRQGLYIFLASKKQELAHVGASLDAEYKREAFKRAIVDHMDREEGVNMIWQVVAWTPNTGGGVGGHNQDDNALDYFQKAKKAPGGLASLQWSARANLIKNLVDGYTAGDEETAIFELLTSCANDGDLHQVINYITWDRLEDEVGERFSKRYPKATYGKKKS